MVQATRDGICHRHDWMNAIDSSPLAFTCPNCGAYAVSDRTWDSQGECFRCLTTLGKHMCSRRLLTFELTKLSPELPGIGSRRIGTLVNRWSDHEVLGPQSPDHLPLITVGVCFNYR